MGNHTSQTTGPRRIPASCIEYTKSRKRIHCFFGHAPKGEPRRTRDFEVAEARFVENGEARRLLHHDQKGLIDMLQTRLAG
jgi:hypothetical protein